MITYVQHSAELIARTDENPTKAITRAARVCKKSSGSADEDRALVTKLMQWEHWSPFEFWTGTWKCVTTRAVSHELVRHRMASYMQESQRYCSYENGLTVIVPQMDNHDAYALFDRAVRQAHTNYVAMLKCGVPREDARLLLPNCTATTILVQMNLREFRHFLNLRTGKAAWHEMRELAHAMYDAFHKWYPDADYLVRDVVHKED